VDGRVLPPESARPVHEASLDVVVAPLEPGGPPLLPDPASQSGGQVVMEQQRRRNGPLKEGSPSPLGHPLPEEVLSGDAIEAAAHESDGPLHIAHVGEMAHHPKPQLLRQRLRLHPQPLGHLVAAVPPALVFLLQRL